MKKLENNMRPEHEISDEFDEATTRVAEQDFRWSGMTYEEGVRDALAWVLAESDDAPLTEED